MDTRALATDGWITTLSSGGTAPYRWENTDIIDVEYVEGTREFNRVAGDVDWQKVSAYRVVDRQEEGWTAYNPAIVPPQGDQLVDVAYLQGTLRCNVFAHSVDWARVRKYRARPTAPGGVRIRNADDAVTLYEARQAMIFVCSAVDEGRVPFPEQIECVKDFLDQQVPGEILKNENVDALRAENTHFREFVVTAMKARIHDAVLIANGSTFEARVCIAIARGHLPVDFMGSLDEWTA